MISSQQRSLHSLAVFFTFFIGFAPSLYLRCHCCWFAIVLISNFERFLNVLYPLLLLFYDVVMVTIFQTSF